MFIRHRYRGTFVAVFLLLLTSACANTSQITKSATDIGTAGQAASQSAVSLLQNVAQLTESEFETDRVKHLIYARPDANPSDVWKAYNAIQKFDHGKAIAPFIKDYKAVAGTYKLFHKLASAGTADDTKKAVTEWSKAWKDLNPDDPAIPESLGTVLGNLAGQWQAKNIRKHNIVLAALSKRAADKWDAVAKILILHIDRSHDHQRNMYMGLPGRVLGRSDIAVANLDGPWIPAVKTRLYFHEKLKAIEASRQTILTNARNVGAAFGKLQKAHTELAKEEPSTISVTNFIDDILDLVRDMRSRKKGSES